jgi:hypothetical protein
LAADYTQAVRQGKLLSVELANWIEGKVLLAAYSQSRNQEAKVQIAYVTEWIGTLDFFTYGVSARKARLCLFVAP